MLRSCSETRIDFVELRFAPVGHYVKLPLGHPANRVLAAYILSNGNRVQAFLEKYVILVKLKFVFDVGKQIEYWINSAKSDLDTAELLIRESRYIHGLFFCHLAIEKALKAHVTKVSGEFPPKTHNLIYLLDLAGLEIEKEFEDFLGILMKYQLEGRYPDYNPIIPSEENVLEYLNKTKMLMTWIERKL